MLKKSHCCRSEKYNENWMPESEIEENLRLKWSYTNEGILKHAVKLVPIFQAGNKFIFTKLIERLQYGNPWLWNLSTWFYSEELCVVNQMQELHSCNTQILTLAS